MVRPEKGSLADRSDIRNRVRLFRQRSRVHQANPNPNSVTGNGSSVQQNGNVSRQNVSDEQSSQNVADRLSPLDISFGSSGTTARASASKTSPTSFQSSTSSTTAVIAPTSTPPPSSKAGQTFLGRQWSPIAESPRRVPSSANATSSLLFEFKSSDSSSPMFSSPSANQSAYTNEDNTKEVVYRRPKPDGQRKSGNCNDVGRPLKAALEKICKHTTTAVNNGNNLNNGNNRNSEYHNVNSSSLEESSAALNYYIGEVFRHLDYNGSGSVAREDFELLCEVLGLTSSSPTSTGFRNSGIEWLSSYMPRPNSPASPLRFDKLSDVKYKGARNGTGKPTMTSQTLTNGQDTRPHFLFTLGPRPFWELWPLRKSKKKHLTIEEFRACLLDRWAKSPRGGNGNHRTSWLAKPPRPVIVGATNGNMLPTTLSSNIFHQTRNHRHIRSTRLTPSPSSRPNTGTATTDSAQSESRTRRVMKRVARVARRYLVIDKLSRRQRHTSSTTTATTSSQQPRQQQQQQQQDQFLLSEDEDDVDLIREVDSPVHLARSLEQQVLRQQTEIANLRCIIDDLRSSLQLSDAQNLAFQVLLKKMTRSEPPPLQPQQQEQQQHQPLQQQQQQSPGVHDETFRSHTMESEEQLENLVRELKAMSQTKYPTTNALLYQQQQHGSSSCSFNGTFNNQDFSMDDEFQETSKALTVAQEELRATQQELHLTLGRLKEKENELQQGTVKMRMIYKALEKAEQEIRDMRIALDDAQKSLSRTKEELQFTKRELYVAQTQLTHSDRMLLETELRLSLLSQSRQSLVLELQATRKLLASSLNLVHDLETESQKVPILQQQISELKRLL